MRIYFSKMMRSLVTLSLSLGILNFVFSGSAEARFTPPPEPDYAVPAAGIVYFGGNAPGIPKALFHRSGPGPQLGDRQVLMSDNGTSTAWTNQTMAKLDPGSHRTTYYRTNSPYRVLRSKRMEA